MYGVIDTTTNQIVAIYDYEDDAWGHVLRPEITTGVPADTLDVQVLDDTDEEAYEPTLEEALANSI